MKEKQNGTTILIAEHRLAWTVDFADRYFYFEDGVLKEEWDNETLCGLLKPVSGQIKWNEQCITGKGLLKKSFLVMQDVDYQLFSDSVREEVVLGTQGDVDCDRVLSDLGLLEYADAHPISLSGGQKQRVAVASAIVANKELTILDEPTSGLDHHHMEQVGSLLQQLKEEGKAIIVITHDEELAADWCDRIVCL